MPYNRRPPVHRRRDAAMCTNRRFSPGDYVDARYRFNGNSASVPMSESSVAWRDAFIQNYETAANFEFQACYVCGGSEFEPLSEVDRYGFWYPTGLCLNCGNVQQTTYYKDSVVKSLYETYYRHIYGNQPPAQLFADQYQHAKSIHDIVDAHLGNGQHRLLEVGTGAGGILQYFADSGYQVTGLDFDKDFIEYGKAKGLNLLLGSIDVLPEEDRFDCIVLSHVLEHIVDPSGFLARLAGKLTDSGCLYVEVPSLNEVMAGNYDCDLLKFYQNAHVIHFSMDSFTNLCGQSGLSVTRIDPSIRAIVTANGDSDFSFRPTDHVDQTRSLLRKIESRRTGLTHRLRRTAKRGIKNTASSVLAKVGLRELVRSALRRKA